MRIIGFVIEAIIGIGEVVLYCYGAYYGLVKKDFAQGMFVLMLLIAGNLILDSKDRKHG